MTSDVSELVAQRGPLPGWFAARSGLRLSIEGTHNEFGESLVEPLTPATRVVLAWTDPDERLVTWLTPGNLSDWHASGDDAWEIAASNLDRVLATAELEIAAIEGHRIAVLTTDSIFKASLLLAPGLRARLEPEIGWPILAVAPCRDFLFLFGAGEQELVGKLVGIVAHEFEGSAFRVTLEVLRLDERGLTAIGAYAEEAP